MCRRSARVLLLASLWAGAISANAGELRSMELVQDGAVTRATLELGDLPDYRLFSLAGPDRVVIDLPATALRSGVRLPTGNGLVANVRTGQPTPDTLRIVLDLGRAIAQRLARSRTRAERRHMAAIEAPVLRDCK